MLVTQLLDDVETGKIKFPHMPEVVIKATKLLDDEKSSINSIVNVIKQDAAISGRILQVSNSVIFGPLQAINTLDQAIIKLGVTLTKSLIYAFSFKDGLILRNEKLRSLFNQIWEENLETAAISVLIAKLVNYVRTDEVFLAAIIHNIGLLTLIAHVSIYFKDDTVDEFVQSYKLGQLNDIIKDISIRIMHEWGLPQIYLESAASWPEPVTYYKRVSPAIIVNLVTVYMMIKSNKLSPDSFNELQLTKVYKITPDTIEFVLEEKKIILENLKKLLR